MSKAMPVYKTQTVVVATAAQLGTGAVFLMKVVIGGQTADTTVQFFNNTAGSGTVLLTLSALNGHSEDFDFTEVGGIAFSTGCFVKPTGANSIAYCWFE